MRYAPLYIHSFEAGAPRRKSILPDYGGMRTAADRIRWWRLRKGLTQAQLAEKLGLSLNGYRALEAGALRHIPATMAKKLAQLYGVAETEFMDEYERFLSDGQAVRIRAWREATGLGKKAFAREMGIPIRNLQQWENGEKTVSRTSWERYFKGRG